MPRALIIGRKRDRSAPLVPFVDIDVWPMEEGDTPKNGMETMRLTTEQFLRLTSVAPTMATFLASYRSTELTVRAAASLPTGSDLLRPLGCN